MAGELRRMGVRLTAEGVNQYKDDLRSAGREARLMSQETRLAMSELGTGASSTEKLTTRLKGLGREYDVQKNRVSLLTNSQKEFQTSLNLVGREVKTTSSQLKDSQRETNRLENNYRKMGEALGWNAEETKKAKAEWEASKVQTKELATSLNELEKEQNQYTRELEKIPGQINSAKISMQEKANEMARLREEYIKNGGELGIYADKIEETSGKIRTFSEGMATVGDRLTAGVTLPIVAGVTAVVKAASDWESAFAGTKKTVDEVVDANGNVVYSYEQLEGELRNLAKQLPATHSEIAGVAEAAGQLGIETENVTSFTRTMIDMGESTNLSAEEAASSLARLANITGMSQNDFDRLGSSVVGLGNNFATTEAEIVQMGLRLSGTGNQIGMTEADIMGLAAAMSSVGIQAEAGGTAMSTTLKRMQNVVATHKDVNEQLAEAKKIMDPKDFENFQKEIAESEHMLAIFAEQAEMSADQFAKAFEEDPARALQAFVEGLEKSSDKGENLNDILAQLEITGIREADTLLRLAGNSELLGDALDLSATSWEENSALAEEAGVRYETLESQMGMLRNEVYDIAIEFGGPFVQALRDAMQAGKPLLENLADMAQAFSDLDEEQQQTIIRLIGITAAAGPTLSILGRVGQGAATAGDGLAWMVRKVGGLQASAKTANPIIDSTGTAIEGVGTTAMAASGSKGVGGLVTAVGTALPWALGVAAVAAGGWAVWKLWGEEAWEAGQRTRRWGTDVGEAVDEALTEVSTASQTATGQFNLMRQGFDTDSGAMVDNFETMGRVIENSLVERISKLDELIAGLPETVEGTLGEVLSEDKKMLEENLEIVQQHNARIAEIRENASNHNREVSIVEAKIIQDLNRESAEAYVKTLGLTQEEQQTILSAMSGDVESATKDQATAWAKSLGEQRQLLVKDRTERRKAFEDDLKETGLYSEARIEELVKMWDEGEKATSDGIDQQLALIAEKYPEIAEEILFANGQVISGNDEFVSSAIKSNEKIINSAKNLSSQLAEQAEENARQLDWLSDSSVEAAQTWNNLVFDEQTGELKTNLKEELSNATQSEEGWNALQFKLQEANLDSNIKQMIAEAVIENGRWDDLDFTTKNAILEDDFSITIYNALVNSGKWNEMELEEQKAIMYSNTPEKMTETLAYLGLWDEYEAEVKEVSADNYDFINTIRNSEEMMNVWESIDPETKELLGENYDLLTAIFQSEERFNAFKQIPDEQKKLMAENTDLLNKVTQSEITYQRWAGLPDNTKRLIAENTELLGPILESEEVYGRFMALPHEEKNLLANNADLLAKILSSEEEYNHWTNLPDSEKHIRVQTNAQQTSSLIQDTINVADILDGKFPYVPTDTNAPDTESKIDDASFAADVLSRKSPHIPTTTNALVTKDYIDEAISSSQGLDSQSPHVPTSTDANTTTGQLDDATGAAQTLDRQSPYITANTNAPTIESQVRSARNSATDKKFTITGIFNRVGDWTGWWRTGTQSLPSTGFSILGDGGKREPYLTPQGHFGVSDNKDELHYLPKGTRIWPSRQSFRTSARSNDGLKQYMDQLPKFAEGGTIRNPYDGYTGLVGEAGPEIFQIAQGKVSITPITQRQRTKVLEGQKGADMTETNELLQSLIQLVAQGQVIQMDGREVGRSTYDEVDSIMNKNFERRMIMNMGGGG